MKLARSMKLAHNLKLARNLALSFWLLAAVAALAPPAGAQCAMCRASAEAATRSGNGSGTGINPRAMASLNAGIYMLLIPPFAIGSAILIAAFRKNN